MTEDEWEVEVRFRRNGRCVAINKGLGDDPHNALRSATNDLTRATQEMSYGFDELTGTEMARQLREISNG